MNNMQVDVSQWTCIYPPYINSKLSVAQGRRVRKEVAVGNPQIPEILEVLKFLALHHAVENKAYPRDILARGRIRIRLKDEQGNYINPEITSSNQHLEKILLLKLCEFIPRLKSRTNVEENKTTKESKKKKKKRRN